MENYEILKDLAIVLLAAKFFGLVARKCKAPMVVGEIIAGLLLGPIIHIVENNDFLGKMAEIGVILIMFSAGLETNLKELKKSGVKALAIAVMGVFIPLVGGTILYLCYYGFDKIGSEQFFKALFVGSIMTATSVGITVECLKEMGFLKGEIGQLIVSAAIIDDVIGIVVLTFVLGFKDPEAQPLRVVGNTFAFLALAVLLGILIYKLMKWVDARYPHSRRIPIIGLGLCFAISFCAEKFFGIADITGAYVAGIMLCNINDAPYVDRKVSVTGYMFFGPIFFVGIGLKTDFSAMTKDMIVFSLLFVLVAMACKVIGCGLITKAFKYPGIDCLKVGVGMMTRGEVALIITQKGLSVGLIDSSFFAPVILLIIVSSITVPILLKVLYAKKPDPQVEAKG
ncbi:MAG: cation:proton antiporter [Lachnospiraceae bacterium]|nr:cation:proton antiporter [Lachnospiraceae bacterium]